MINLFITLIYQPFFNILVFFYWLIGFIPGQESDMGIAVILLTILIRILLLPLSFSADRTEKERREIAEKVVALNKLHSSDPVAFRREKKEVFKTNRRILLSEFSNLAIQVMIALMLYKIFTTGLEGADLYLLYPFMPDVPQPYNLYFLGQYDLAHTNFTLNVIQSVLIFILETVNMYTSPFPVKRGDVVRLQLILPVVSFIVFINFPAGKKLFVITSLIFSICLTLIKTAIRKYHELQEKWNPPEKKEEPTGPFIVIPSDAKPGTYPYMYTQDQKAAESASHASEQHDAHKAH